MDIKLSVLVTCYNQKKYIEEAIDSIYVQKCDFPYEVIVGDDGSDDGSYELLCEKYGDRENLKIVRNLDKKNDIPSATSASRMRIELLKYVNGEYFTYLDGDDFYYDSLKFQKQLEILDSDQELVLCGSSFYFYDQASAEKELFTGGMSEGYIDLKCYWRLKCMHANTCIIRSSVIDNFPYDRISDIFHDNLITFSVMLQGKGYYWDSPSMCYRQESEGSHIYIGSHKIVTWLRHTIMTDVCDIIGPQYRKESWHRYYNFYVELFKHRTELAGDASLEYWIKLAERLGCRKTLDIIYFNDLHMVCKTRMKIKYLFAAMQSYWTLCLRRLIRLMVKAKRIILGLKKI